MRKLVTLIPGDGIGPEIVKALLYVFEKIETGIDFEMVNAGKATLDSDNQLIKEDVYQSIEKTKCAIKGPITTPIGEGFRSVNVSLRKKYDLYQNIRPIKGVKPCEIDFVIFRENTEGLYIGEEKQVAEGVFEATKRISTKGSYRIIKAAFEYAVNHNRKKVTVVHKANILKLTDGEFLRVARLIKKDFPTILYDEMIVDNACMQLVKNPLQFDVIVTMNLYGDIISDLSAGLVGGLGLVPGANIGDEIAIFESVHGSAPDIQGLGRANPIALLRTSVMMLQYLDKKEIATRLEQAILDVLAYQDVIPYDLGGHASTMDIAKAIVERYEMIV